MEAAKFPAREPREDGLQTVRMITETLRVVTDKRCELYNLTERIADILRRHDVKDGMVLLSSLHTTMALFVNEWQSALLHDVKSMLNKVVSPNDGWQHDDPALRLRPPQRAFAPAGLAAGARALAGRGQGQAGAGPVPGHHRRRAGRPPQPGSRDPDHRDLI